MKDMKKKPSRTLAREESGAEFGTPRRRAYERPKVETFDSKTILQAVGPAQGIYGALPGATGSL